MKNATRGNYRVLYRDLQPDLLYNHFRIVAEQDRLVAKTGLSRASALKAVREMARVHFCEQVEDGTWEGKKAWYGHRWIALYQQWGNYISERDRDLNTEDLETAEALNEPESLSAEAHPVSVEELDPVSAELLSPVSTDLLTPAAADLSESSEAALACDSGPVALLHETQQDVLEDPLAVDEDVALLKSALSLKPALNALPPKAWQSKLTWLTLAAMFLLTLVGYYIGRASTVAPPSPLVSADVSSTLLRDDEFKLYRDRMLSSGSLARSLVFPDLDGISAVFVRPGNAVVLVQDREIHVNDLIALENVQGLVSEIQPDRLILDTQKGMVQCLFPTHLVMGQATYASGEVVIYPSPANLNSILSSIATMNGWVFTSGKNQHSISGKFESIDAFMNACRYFGVIFQPGKIQSPDADKPKSYISFGGIWNEPSGTLPALIDVYAEHLSMPVKMEGSFSKQRWVINYGLQFDEFCDYFNLKTEVREDHIIVQGGLNEEGSISD